MKLVLVRHAESENNEMYAKIKAEYKSQLGTATNSWKVAAKRAYLPKRSSDPGITAAGRVQAQQLARHYTRPFIDGGGNVTIFCSALCRTTLTATPLAVALNERITIRGDLHEVGGVYQSSMDEKGNIIHNSADSPSREEILEKYPIVKDVSDLPATGPWYKGGRESWNDANARARRVAEWLKSEDLATDIGANGVCVVFTHGNFLDLLLKALLGNHVQKEEKLYEVGNTAVVSMEINGSKAGLLFLDNTAHLVKPQSSWAAGGTTFITMAMGTLVGLALSKLLSPRR